MAISIVKMVLMFWFMVSLLRAVTGSALLDRMWETCHGNIHCRSVYMTGLERDTFVRHVVISLDTSPQGDLSGSVLASLETLYDASNGTNSATWDHLILDLLNKFDICHHNEYFDLVTNTCVCTSDTVCITPALYTQHTGLVGRIILFVLLAGMFVTIVVMFFRSFRARQIIDDMKPLHAQSMRYVRSIAAK